MENLRVNNKEAIRITARKIRSFKRQGKLSILFDCEGDEVWFPSAHIQQEDGTILIEKWLYDAKVKDGQL
jgi:hypothetical protein